MLLIAGEYIHIGVGFEVAYLYRMGKFEGLGCEIGNGYESHASFIKDDKGFKA